MTSIDSINLLGLRVDRVSMEQAMGNVEQFIAEKRPTHVVTADASMVVLSRQDPELAAIAQAADLVTPDGAGILWASRLLGQRIAHKVSGVDMVGQICRLSQAKGYRLFFLGSAPGVTDAAADNLRQKYPGVQIAGTQHGFFGSDQEDAVVHAIADLCTDVVFVAFGIPKQEKFITRYKEAMGASVYIGVGGSFDVYSGLVKRAPVWMQNAGLEWVFRLYQNPKKISKVLTLPKFALLVLKTRIFGGR